DADVGVVDVAVDVVGGDAGVVEAVPHLVRGEAEVEQVAVHEQGMGIAGRDAAAGHGVVEDLLNGSSGGCEVHSFFTLPYPLARRFRTGLWKRRPEGDSLQRSDVSLA